MDAKGVLAERHGLSMEDAYDRLVDDAAEAGRPLTEWADALIAEVQGRS